MMHELTDAQVEHVNGGASAQTQCTVAAFGAGAVAGAIVGGKTAGLYGMAIGAAVGGLAGLVGGLLFCSE